MGGSQGPENTRELDTELALRRSEELRRLALEAAELGTWDFDLPTMKVLWDERASEIFGASPRREIPWTELVGTFVHPDDRARLRATVEAATDAARPDGDEIVYIEYRIVRPDGALRWLEVRGESFFEGRRPERHLARFIGTVADVTKRKNDEQALRESEAHFRDLADNIAQLAWMADDRGWIFWYNQRWYDYTGTTPEEMQGWGWSKVHHPEHVGRVVQKLAQCFVSGEPWEDTFPLRGRDGRYRWFLSRAIPLRDAEGKVTRWFGTNTDVTEQRTAEEALREANRRQREYLAALSHELRNPLTPIWNGVQILKRAAPGGPQATHALAMIDRQLHHMTRLIDDLLDITRVSRGKIRIVRERLELGDLIRRTVDDHRALFERSSIALTAELDPRPTWVEGDPTRIAQILSNLLDNAAKFTAPGGHVRVTTSREDDAAEICVEDDGAGIAPELLGKLFEPFVQAQQTLDRSRGGLGLGLAMVKSLVALHGGTVRAESEGSGRGATFTVRLPLAARDARDDERRDPQSPGEARYPAEPFDHDGAP